MNPANRQLLQKSLELHQKGQLRDAIKGYDQVLLMSPDSFDALHLKGLATYQTGNATEAIPILSRAIKLRSGIPAAYNSRGLALQACGKVEMALKDFGKAIELKPDFAEAHCNKANALREMGRLADAQSACVEALRHNPGMAEIYNSLGVILKEGRDWQAAQENFTRAIKLKPNYLEALNNLGNVFKELRRFDEALACFDRALTLNRTHAQTYSNRGTALQELERFEEAVESYQKAINLKPDHAFAWVGLADIESRFGKFAAAQEKYEKARVLDPHAVAPLCGLAEVRAFSGPEPLIQEIEERLSGRSMLDEDRSRLHHAYGKICNDLGRYDDAMAHFRAGKQLLKSSFSMAQHKERYAAMKRLFTREFFTERQGLGVQDERPVFIVGMPRSGTTLVEQILASHHLAEGLGELPYLARIASRLGWVQPDPQAFVQSVRTLGPDDVNRMGESYRQAYSKADPSHIRLIDKMPHNFQWLGLVALMFPKARIIHCRRTPLDTCVSLYMQGYINQHGYAKELETLGTYYREYDALMDHWRAVLPIPILDCRYEQVISDFEAKARELVAFLGLPWDPNCLNYHTQAGHVSTASRWQVRQPLYGSSVGRWRRYDRDLGPLKHALGVSNASDC
jgi:tetratricopeptide (TPR) repeat protein